jgi:hypothetical protein
MQFARRDADLRSEPVAVAVGKSRRSVVKHSRSVNLAEESLGGNGIIGHDRLGVRRPVLVDVFDRVIKRLNNTNGKNKIGIFVMPIIVANSI